MTEILVHPKQTIYGALQSVVSGNIFERFVQSQKAGSDKSGLSDLGAYNLRTSTQDILNHCNPHNATENFQTTHLVVGYVQSGKTMSFTGVLAMARDNGYRIAIVLTGVTTNLQNQTTERLQHDLSLGDDEDFCFLPNPEADGADEMIKCLRLSTKPLIIIPILKHRKYIDSVTDLFSNPKLKNALVNETVLIIDDEADQASLNGFCYSNSKLVDPKEHEIKETAIYGAIHLMRGQLPGNSYIQYTATPQANILIPMTDLLSPKSHTLLIPGEDYIGGKKFFGLEKNGDLFKGNLVVEIPPEEVYHKKKNTLRNIPKSLVQAIKTHVMSVILVVKWYKRKNIKQLTMLVHPTDIIEGNKTFESWINKELMRWSDTLAKPQSHEDRIYLLNSFKPIFQDAIKFYPIEGRPSFDDIKTYIPDVINSCAVYRITGDSEDDSTKIPWNSHRMNILIGAQMLNRGFTVKNLSTTYMPRYTLGITNADTIEQRCRFFGYKKDYIESCRVYLPKQMIEDYKSYVLHEEELRGVLQKCSSLKDFEHQVMLTPHLRPTRINVLPKKIIKNKLLGWVKFDRFTTGTMIKDNLAVVDSFVNSCIINAQSFSTLSYATDSYPGNDVKRHIKVNISIKELLNLLENFTPGTYTDVINKSLTVRYLQGLDEIQDIDADIIFMSSNRIRTRRYNSADIDQEQKYYRKIALFQGRSKSDDDVYYCGDSNIYNPDKITVQVHHLMIKDQTSIIPSLEETYTIAIHFPEKLATLYYSNFN